MEALVFRSPKRHRVVAVKKLLAGNGIPTASVKLHIRVEWSQGGRNLGGGRYSGAMEERNDLNVPIEEFDDKLNDAQTFELYVPKQYEGAAVGLIDECDEETFFGDCVFRSGDYDEAFEIFSLLNKNGIPCEDIFPGIDEYLLFIEPEHLERARKLIEENGEEKLFKHKNIRAKDTPDTAAWESRDQLRSGEYRETSLFKSLFSRW